jgi:hypothetical protein
MIPEQKVERVKAHNARNLTAPLADYANLALSAVMIAQRAFDAAPRGDTGPGPGLYQQCVGKALYTAAATLTDPLAFWNEEVELF